LTAAMKNRHLERKDPLERCSATRLADADERPGPSAKAGGFPSRR
jgi:hypothetical protein